MLLLFSFWRGGGPEPPKPADETITGGGPKASWKDYRFLNPPSRNQLKEAETRLELAKVEQELEKVRSPESTYSDTEQKIYVALLQEQINALQAQYASYRAILEAQHEAMLTHEAYLYAIEQEQQEEEAQVLALMLMEF